LRLVVDYLEGSLSVATWYDSAWIGGTASGTIYRSVVAIDCLATLVSYHVPSWTLNSTHSLTRGVLLVLAELNHSTMICPLILLRWRANGRFIFTASGGPVVGIDAAIKQSDRPSSGITGATVFINVDR